jgi:hypothetical protein
MLNAEDREDGGKGTVAAGRLSAVHAAPGKLAVFADAKGKVDTPHANGNRSGVDTSAASASGMVWP